MYGDPLWAVFSDSVNRINARISKEAALQYHDDTQKRFTNGTVGGLIQLLDFEIHAIPYGERPKRIILHINKFKPLGSNGSGLYGLPQAIEDRREIFVIVEKLKEFREQENNVRARSRPNTPHKKSLLTSQPTLDHGSQAVFATQIPLSRVSAGGSRKPELQRKGAGSSPRIIESNVETSITSNAPSPADSESQHEQSDVEVLRSARPQKRSFAGTKSTATSHNDLLSILQAAQGVLNNNLRPVESAPLQANVASSEDLPPFSGSNTTSQQPPRPIASTSSRTSPKSRVFTTEKKSPKENQRRSNTPPVETKSTANATSKKTRNRIKRHDVMISKDQEALLNSKDCK